MYAQVAVFTWILSKLAALKAAAYPDMLVTCLQAMLRSLYITIFPPYNLPNSAATFAFSWLWLKQNHWDIRILARSVVSS